MEAATSYSMKLIPNEFNLSSKKLQMDRTKKQKEEAKREKKGDKKTKNRLKQPCIFGPERLSRKFLESKFGILFRPNVANNTRSSLCKTKWSASTTV